MYKVFFAIFFLSEGILINYLIRGCRWRGRGGCRCGCSLYGPETRKLFYRLHFKSTLKSLPSIYIDCCGSLSHIILRIQLVTTTFLDEKANR